MVDSEDVPAVPQLHEVSRSVLGRLGVNSAKPITTLFEAVVTGYDFDAPFPLPIVEVPTQPDPFTAFQSRFDVGDEINVVVEACEPYVNDRLLYLIVRELDTKLEIVMDPYDVSLIGRNFAMQPFEAGQTMLVSIEEIGLRSVRVTRLKESLAARTRLIGDGKE